VVHILDRKGDDNKLGEERFRLFAWTVIAIGAIGIGVTLTLVTGIHILTVIQWLPIEIVVGEFVFLLIPSIAILLMGIYGLTLISREKKSISRLDDTQNHIAKEKIAEAEEDTRSH
jgi:uncharacterized protein YacL